MITLTEKCTLCGNRCKLTSLKCKRGINYYARLEKENKEANSMESKNNEVVDNHVDKVEVVEVDVNNSRIKHGKETSTHCKSHRDNSPHTEDELTNLLMKTNHMFHHKKGHKRGQGKILKILSKRGEMNQKELQEILEIESGTMSEFVIKLEQKGFITRAKDELDKRQTKLTITEDGLHRVNELRSKDKLDTNKVYETLTQEEQEQLKMLLRKLHTGTSE